MHLDVGHCAASVASEFVRKIMNRSVTKGGYQIRVICYSYCMFVLFSCSALSIYKEQHLRIYKAE